jgi:SAM-dependent methyltransferase
MHDTPQEVWGVGAPYERYVGRWSRAVARAFVDWLAVPAGAVWADVGCGTGALVEGILTRCAPRAVIGLDRSAGFVVAAQHQISDARVHFQVGNAAALPWPAAAWDVTVSGLVLNFVVDPTAMAREMVRVTRPGGTVAAYVWDYAGGMAMMRHFWDAAVAVSPQDAKLDQAERFPLCRPEPLATLWQDLGLTAVVVRAIDIPTVFRDFADYWTPFLGEQGAAPTYLASIDAATQERIRAVLHARLRPAPDGTIALTARAWAVQGRLSQPWMQRQ